MSKTRKELKEEYKQMKFQIGVFQIKNKLNGKSFVGSSLDLKAIWNAQRFQLNYGMHQNSELQKDWKELGADNFVYEIIDEIKQNDENAVDYRKEVKILETMIVEELKPYYNNASFSK